MIEVKFAKLHSSAVIPSYARPGDNGLDLTAIDYTKVIEADFSYHEYQFGLTVEIPEGYVGLIFPRSSVSNRNLMLTNSVGVIDSSYRGPLSARFRYTDYKQFELRDQHATYFDKNIYKIGDRVAQLVILPCPQISVVETSFDELSKTKRGSGSFGSTGV